RLRPADRHEQRPRAGKQVLLASAADLADEADSPTVDVRLDVTLEEASLPGLDHSGEDKVLSGGAGDLDRAMGALLGRHPPDPQHVVVIGASKRPGVDGDRV